MKELELDCSNWLHKRRFKRQLPERWEEVSAKQLIAIAHLSIGDIDDNAFFSQLCDVPVKFVKRLGDFQKWMIGQQLLFTSGYEPWYKFILKLPGLAPPRPRMEGMTFGQLMFVDTFYGDWIEDPSDDNLNKFVGSVYIPAGEKFDSEKVGQYSENAAQLQQAERIAVTLNYRLLKEWLTNLYPTIFVRPEEDPDEDKHKKTSVKNTGGWLVIFESIVGDDIIHQEEYFELSAHTVLRFMAKKIKENAKR